MRTEAPDLIAFTEVLRTVTESARVEAFTSLLPGIAAPYVMLGDFNGSLRDGLDLVDPA